MQIERKETDFFKIFFYILIFIITSAGIYIRTRLYLARIPLWLDEIMLGYSFTDYSLSKILTNGLEAFQKAPPLFSFAVLTIRKLFGINELTLRFIPYLSGILSILIFYILIKKNINSKLGIITCLTLFSFCTPLIYFSAEFKPYGWDVFICILLLLSYEHINFNNASLTKILLYTAGTISLIFLSFPTIFLIPAIIISKIIENKKFDWKILWIFSGIILSALYLYLYDMKTYYYLKDYWGSVEKGFNAFPTISFLWNFLSDLCKYYIYDFKATYSNMLIILAFCGFGLLYKEKKYIAPVAIFTILFTIIASSIQVYPLKPKLILFMAPIFIISVAKIFDITLYMSSSVKKILTNAILFICLINILGINIPYLNMTENEIVYYNEAMQGRNKSIQDRNLVKDVSLKILNEMKITDKILTSQEFEYSIKYYKFYHNIDKTPDITAYGYKNSNNINELIKEFINQNKNSRLWIIGRDNEYYFKCPSCKEIVQILKENNLKFKTYKTNDLYLIEIN